ncbi:MAG: hypothetical protein AAFO98_02325 [Pseudomonadota bacterium]
MATSVGQGSVAQLTDIGEKLAPQHIVFAPVLLPRRVSAAITWGSSVRSSGRCQFGEAFEVLGGCGEEEFFGCS